MSHKAFRSKGPICVKGEIPSHVFFSLSRLLSRRLESKELRNRAAMSTNTLSSLLFLSFSLACLVFAFVFLVCACARACCAGGVSGRRHDNALVRQPRFENPKTSGKQQTRQKIPPFSRAPFFSFPSLEESRVDDARQPLRRQPHRKPQKIQKRQNRPKKFRVVHLSFCVSFLATVFALHLGLVCYFGYRRSLESTTRAAITSIDILEKNPKNDKLQKNLASRVRFG